MPKENSRVHVWPIRVGYLLLAKWRMKDRNDSSWAEIQSTLSYEYKTSYIFRRRWPRFQNSLVCDVISYKLYRQARTFRSLLGILASDSVDTPAALSSDSQPWIPRCIYWSSTSIMLYCPGSSEWKFNVTRWYLLKGQTRIFVVSYIRSRLFAYMYRRKSRKWWRHR